MLWSCLLTVATQVVAQDILKFDIGPADQRVYEGFTAVGPESNYTSAKKFGWTEAPKYFEKFSRFEAFPDALTCDLAAPSAPLAGNATGYKGTFEFRVDVPPGRYGVMVISGNYGYLPSQIETAAYDVEKKQYKAPAPEEILANSQRVFYREFTSDDLVNEFYHDLNTILRRGMTLWDRVVAWRFPARMFEANVGRDGLRLRFVNMPVNDIVVWPAAKAAEARAFIDKLWADRRAKFPAKDLTPPPEGDMPPLPADANAKGYFLFVPHYSDDIYPNTIPKPEWMKNEIKSFASLGEFESFSFGVYPLKDLQDCQTWVSDLVSADGARLASSAVDVRVLRYLELQANQYSAGYRQLAYVPLKWGRIPIDRGVNRVYWLTIRPPDNTRPGTYIGTITFKPANAPASALRLTFRVLPFKLRPLTDHFQALYHDYDQFPGGGPDQRVRWQRDTGFNVITTFGRINNVRYKDGVLGPLDFSDWEKKLDVYRRNGFPMQLVISQGATSPAYSATGEYHAEPEYKGSAHSVKDRFSAQFEDCYKKLARAISDEFKRRGWPEIIFYDGGELACEGPRGVRTETHLMKLLHEAGVKNTTSVSGPSTPLSLQNSVPFMYLTIMNDVNPENIAKVRAAGSRFGAYGPGETRFERGFWFWRSGAMVCSEEGGVIVYGNPYDPFDGSKKYDWGDVYPSPDGPVPSVKTIGKRKGIDDSKYLFHLEALIAEANQRGTEPAKAAAAKARQLLDNIAAGIQVDIQYYRTQAEQPPGEVLDALRLKIAERIIALEELLKK